MNEKEQAAADSILDKIVAAASSNDVMHLTTAYHSLTQGALARKQAEAIPEAQ